jgi:phosphoglycerate dehydrogenase-like enzyme
LLLGVARGIVFNAIDTRAGNWRRRSFFIPLRGKTLGIVGLGRIGRSVAVRGAAFGMQLAAYEEMPDMDFVKKYNVALLDLDALLARSDFVSLHTPMTPRTEKLINRQTIARMKPGSVLVNTARGGLVDEEALLDALKSGHLAGAGLDVLATEPPPEDHPFFALDNVIISPHVAALDQQAMVDMSVGAARNIVEVLGGKWPAGALVNPDVKAAWKT